MILLWRTTSRCNYACGFCAYDRRLGGVRREVIAEEALRFGRLVAAWGRSTGTRVLLSWLGGEPMLWRPVLPLSATLHREGGVAISATTNGSTLGRPAVREAILASFAELTVSVDGFAPTHDPLRGAPGSWSRVRDGVRALVRERGGTGTRLRVNAVLMRSTTAAFPALCDEVADWGVDEITFNQLGGRDRPEFFPDERLRPEDVARLAAALPGLRTGLARRGVRLCADLRYVDRLAASAAGRAVPADACRLGEDFLFVDEHGLVAPCSFSTADYGVPIADLRTVADLRALPARFARAHAAARCPTCDDCPSTHVFAKFAA
jgi:MoaA/NifB/PqqE/SkfB family radical SAM enzyme